MELFCIQCRTGGCYIQFYELYADPRLEILVPIVSPLYVMDRFRFYRGRWNKIEIGTKQWVGKQPMMAVLMNTELFDLSKSTSV